MTEQKSPDGGSVRLFDPLPTGFDYLSASEEALRRHGIPPRPGDDAPARLREQWHQIFSRRPRFIAPAFRPVKSPRMGKRKLPERFGPATDLWAGSVVQPQIPFSGGLHFPQTDLIQSVSSLCTVANGYFNMPNPQNYQVSSWIGIDGFAPQSLDLLQVGYIVAPSINGGTFAWWEWFPDTPWELYNLQVSPGDVLFLYINRTIEPGIPVICLINRTNNEGVTFEPTGSQGQSLVGSSAKWMIERAGNSFGQTNVVNFADIYYDVAYAQSITTTFDPLKGASTSQAAFLDISQGKLLTLVGATGNILASPTILAPEVMKTSWVASE